MKEYSRKWDTLINNRNAKKVMIHTHLFDAQRYKNKLIASLCMTK